MNEIAILKGHTSPETALVVEDWPYGRQLRCKMRFWLEHKKKMGFRLCSQSTNPTKAGEVWNKPHCSTYSALAVMVQYDKDEAVAAGVRSISWVGFSNYDMSEDKLAEFVAKYGMAFTEAHERIVVDMRVAIRVYNARRTS